jgi:hypothetical protein
MIKKILIGLTIGIAGIVVVAVFCLIQFLRPAGSAREIAFTIEPGEGVHG